MINFIKLSFLLFLAIDLALAHPHEGSDAQSTHSSKETASTPIFGLVPEAKRERQDVNGESTSLYLSTQTGERKKREEMELGDVDEERKELGSAEQSGLESANETTLEATAASKEKHKEEQATTKASETSGEHTKKEKRDDSNKEVGATTEYANKQKISADNKETENAKKEKREAGSNEKRENASKGNEDVKKEKREADSKEAEHGKKQKRATRN